MNRTGKILNQGAFSTIKRLRSPLLSTENYTMQTKEAKARIKINKLLEESGWRFIDDDKSKANTVLEPKSN